MAWATLRSAGGGQTSFYAQLGPGGIMGHLIRVSLRKSTTVQETCLQSDTASVIRARRTHGVFLDWISLDLSPPTLIQTKRGASRSQPPRELPFDMKPDHAQATAVTDALNLDPTRTHHRGRLAPGDTCAACGTPAPAPFILAIIKKDGMQSHIRSLTAGASSLNLLYVHMMTR